MVATSGVMGNKSEAALPEYNITLRIQPTNDSIMYLTPWSFSSDESPVEKKSEQKNLDEKII